MISKELKGLIIWLKKQGKMKFLEAVPESKLIFFEAENNLKLPQKYKEFLHYSDGCDLFIPAGVQLYGVAHEPIIDKNDNDRPNENFIVIGALSTGDPIVFEKSKEQISIYNHEAGRIEDDETFSDFFDFLKNLPELIGIGE